MQVAQTINQDVSCGENEYNIDAPSVPSTGWTRTGTDTEVLPLQDGKDSLDLDFSATES